MAYLKQDELAEVRGRMRSMFFSNETIDAFLSGATPGQITAVDGMIAHEIEVRERRKRQRLLRRARIPQVKSFDGYDFSQVAFPDGYGADDLTGLSFVDAAQDFVFYGQTGRGKTHLACAIGLSCVNLGKEVRFYTAAELVMALTRARAESRLERALADIARAELLIVDELGYVPLDREGARLLFQAMGDCYEKRSLVITTNIEFSKWGVVFGDDKMASALIDRIMHHGRLVEFGGPSKRMEHALMLGKSDR